MLSYICRKLALGIKVLSRQNFFAQRYLRLFLLSLMWGSQFIFNKWALENFSPLLIGFSRAFIGAVFLSILLFVFSKEKSFFSMQNKKSIFFIALFEVTLPFLLVLWGQRHVDSIVASLLMGMIPIIVVILLMLLRYETMTIFRLLGVGLGFFAVFILTEKGQKGLGLSGHLLGKSAIVAAAVSFAVGSMLIRYFSSTSPWIMARDILWFGCIQMLPFLFLLGGFPSHVSWFSISSLLMLGIFCSGLPYLFYVGLVKDAGPAFASFCNYLVPLFGVLLGVLFLKEPLSWNFLTAGVLIFLALGIGNLRST